MSEWLYTLNPVIQSLVAGLFTWAVTATGAAVVVFTKQMSRALLDAMLGFAAGVMIAASCWSLLVPAIDMATAQGTPAWLPATVGFILGGVFLRLADEYLPHLHPGLPEHKAEGVKTSWERATLLVLAITLHNIPEGLAVGVAFGAVAAGVEAGTEAPLGAAIALTIIGFTLALVFADCAGQRHRAAKFSRGYRGGDAAAWRGRLSPQELLVRTALGDC